MRTRDEILSTEPDPSEPERRCEECGTPEGERCPVGCPGALAELYDRAHADCSPLTGCIECFPCDPRLA